MSKLIFPLLRSFSSYPSAWLIGLGLLVSSLWLDYQPKSSALTAPLTAPAARQRGWDTPAVWANLQAMASQARASCQSVDLNQPYPVDMAAVRH